jgi:hypothetical protein
MLASSSTEINGAAADTGFQDTLGLLDKRVVRVASDMKPQHVSSIVYMTWRATTSARPYLYQSAAAG